LSIDSADYQIKEFVHDIKADSSITLKDVSKKIMRFFNAYDASRDLNIIALKRKLAEMKKFNRKLNTHPVCDYAEKVEMESLFLACVSVSK